MKKKIVSMLLVLSMVMGVCACGKEGGTKEETSNDTDVVVETEVDATESESESVVESEHPEWLGHLYTENNFGYSMWITNIEYGSVGYGYQCLGTAEEKTEKIYITQYSGEVGDERQLEEIDMSTYQSSEDIFDLLAPNINPEIFDTKGFGYTMSDYSVEIIETKEVNGVQMTKFEGIMNVVFDASEAGFTDIENYEYPFVAYGIAAKNTPVLVTCIDQSEDQRYHEEWLTKIDELVATFKDAE